MNILTIGDVFGRPGRKLLTDKIKQIKEQYNADFVIVNCENASGGSGLSARNANDLLDIEEVDVYTSGNHIWDKRDVNNIMQESSRLLRPANYPEPCPGRGYGIYRVGAVRIGVINLSGTVFMSNLDNPFHVFDKIYEQISDQCDFICVDFHAEASSEKIAFGYYADERSSIIFGTHTHVQTADERILAYGCGYITDIGMTGPLDGVIGVKKEIIVKQFLSQRRSRYEVADGATQLNGALFELDEAFKCVNIKRIFEIFD